MTGSLTARQAAIFVAVITCVAFVNSFVGKFVFDDIPEIERNPAMETLLPPWEAMFVGNKLPARPLPYLTFAIDHALWGKEPFGYHFTNLLIHMVAALAVFDIARLTLLSPRLRARYGDRAVLLAMMIAMIWAVHPLQTQAVTYVYQRFVSMTGMFCLVSLAAFARAAASGWPAGLLAGSVAAAAAAMISKENAVVLPLLILAYDWFFVVPEPPAPWVSGLWRRRRYYAFLFGTWCLIGLQLAAQAWKYQEFKETKHPPFDYLLTQSGVILWYLRLAVLPVGQQLDYSSWPVATSPWEVLPALAVILGMIVATAVGMVHRRPWAWLPLAFFLALAPTSSILPIEAVANEHRMYLALAAVVATVVLGAVSLEGWLAKRRSRWLPLDPRLPAVMGAVLTMLLVFTTQFRNQLYSKVGGIWLDVLSKDPENYRANWMLASIFDGAGETEIGIEFAERSIQRRPITQVFSDLAGFHSMNGDQAGAERICRRGLELQLERLDPEDKAVLATTSDLAVALRHQQKYDEAGELCAASIDAMRRVLGDDDPATIGAGLILAEAADRRGNAAEAESLARSALAAARRRGGPPDVVAVNATVVLANILRRAGRSADAEAELRQAVDELSRSGNKRHVDVAPLDDALADVLDAAGRIDELVALRRRLAAELERRLGLQHPLTRAAAAKLAAALATQRTATGDHAGAAVLYRQLLAAYAVAFGADHPDTVAMKRRLEAAEAAAMAGPRAPAP